MASHCFELQPFQFSAVNTPNFVHFLFLFYFRFAFVSFLFFYFHCFYVISLKQFSVRFDRINKETCFVLFDIHFLAIAYAHHVLNVNQMTLPTGSRNK